MRIRWHKKFLKDFRDTKLPPESKDNALSGNYKDCHEFYLGGDMLIIYIESAVDEVVLMRIGTHSQLF